MKAQWCDLWTWPEGRGQEGLAKRMDAPPEKAGVEPRTGAKEPQAAGTSTEAQKYEKR